MNVSPRDQIGTLQQKHENQRNQQSEKRSKSSRPWSSFRNPRIVHPSRFSGAKDRHSKVCTIRGLRDRRIRLSVATALQLYNLQERLNLTQPSKVIDWLLEETKHEIDNLPPLHFPPILLSNSASHHELDAYPSSYHSSFDLNQTHTNQDCGKRSNLEQEKVDKNKNHGCTILNQDGGVNSTNFTIPIFPNNVMINPANPYFNWEFFPFMRHGVASQADQATYSGQPVFTPNNSSIFGPRLENESRKYKQFLNPQMLSNNLVTTSFSSMNPLSSMFNLHPQRQETSNGSTSSDS